MKIHFRLFIWSMLFVVSGYITAQININNNNILYPVCKDGKWGYINSSGNVVVSAIYDIAFPFDEGKAMTVQDNDKQFIDHSGKTVLTIPATFMVHTSFSEGLLGYVNENGAGFLTPDGQLTITNNFAEVKPFSDGYAVYKDKDSGLYGAIDKTGKIKIMPQFTYLSDFISGYAIYKLSNNHQYGLIDKAGKIFLVNRYTYLTNIFDGLIGTWNGSTKVKYIDIEKKEVFKAQVFKDNNRPSHFQLPLYPFSNGIVKYYDPFKNKYGFLNKKGEVEIPAQFDAASNYSNGLIAVKQGAKWGYANKKGVLKIRVQFDEATDFKDGVAAVYLGGSAKDFLDKKSNVKMGYINKKGDFIWKYSN
ncbi:WG containing repeat-containing protein [Saccharicrinis carchari]|uniref:WG containing repeat-containing protein n=1 Tax=Saccharicrinis carchari TaxID=1168039 RepID=A0A521FAH3_SACCC|nr:WG repeat-containing protein [Saccharicrinis carchari]SMO92641.1 WG containing repeat-containing protein [Saccharicrinis carchari]